MPRFSAVSVFTWCIRVICWCVLAGAASPALADICVYVDKDGNKLYSNVAPEKGWKKVSCAGGDEAPRSTERSAKSSPTPSGFPRVDPGTQRGRDDLRRRVLSDELGTEERLLVEARTAYANGAPQPLPDEQANAQKYAERLSKLRQAVSLHEKNVESLKKELSRIR